MDEDRKARLKKIRDGFVNSETNGMGFSGFPGQGSDKDKDKLAEPTDDTDMHADTDSAGYNNTEKDDADVEGNEESPDLKDRITRGILNMLKKKGPPAAGQR